MTGTKTYYPAAGAMRVNNTLYYVLADHLGSASTVLDASGTPVGKQRYYPFGETRYVTGSMYTDKLYTGQRAITGLGIYHYNARFYSPYTNHFLSADTIVPGMSNPQNLNRFSYVLNNPLRYTDPSGHKYCDGQGESDCSRYSNSIEHTALKYRIRFRGNWKLKDKVAALEAAEAVGSAFATERGLGETASTAFRTKYKPITLVSVADYEYVGRTYKDGCKTEVSTITCADITYGYFQSTVNNIVHEFGHLLDNRPGMQNVFTNAVTEEGSPSWVSGDKINSNALLNPNSVYDPNYGTAEAIQGILTVGPPDQWADAFANYVAGNIDLTDPNGPGADMYTFVTGALAPHIGTP